MDVIGHLHGLPGVFLACLFSGTLRYLQIKMFETVVKIE